MKVFPQRALWMSLSLALVLGAAGCHGNQNTAVTDQNPSQDPASANVVPISNTTTGAPAGSDNGAPANSDSSQSQPASSQYPADEKPRKERRSSPAQYPPDQYSQDQYQQDPYSDNYSDDSGYDQPVEYAQQPPPPLPVYDQPPCPGDDYIWTPGYWNYDSGGGYYWVPGAWVTAPYQGALWMGSPGTELEFAL